MLGYIRRLNKLCRKALFIFDDYVTYFARLCYMPHRTHLFVLFGFLADVVVIFGFGTNYFFPRVALFPFGLNGFGLGDRFLLCNGFFYLPVNFFCNARIFDGIVVYGFRTFFSYAENYCDKYGDGDYSGNPADNIIMCCCQLR